MPFEQTDVAHHSKVKDSSSLVSSTCSQKDSSVLFKESLRDGVFVTVKRCKAPAVSGVP